MAEDGILPYSELSFWNGDPNIFLIVMTRGICLSVDIRIEDMKDSQDENQKLYQEYTSFLHRLKIDDQLFEELDDWLMRPCFRHPHLQSKLDGYREPQSTQEFFHGETMAFRLHNKAGILEATRIPIERPVANELFAHIPLSHRLVCRAMQQGIPCLPASQIQIVRKPHASEWERTEMPRIVQVIGEKRLLYFKAAFVKEFFERELDILTRIEESDSDRKIRTSRLAGLLQWDDDSTIGGLLIEYISDARTLGLVAKDATPAERSTWSLQLHNAVVSLHDIGVVWGDVKPENILIDSKSQAWVIDFGGGYSPPWVDKELECTRDGDLQGLTRLAQFLSRQDNNASMETE